MIDNKKILSATNIPPNNNFINFTINSENIKLQKKRIQKDIDFDLIVNHIMDNNNEPLIIVNFYIRTKKRIRKTCNIAQVRFINKKHGLIYVQKNYYNDVILNNINKIINISFKKANEYKKEWVLKFELFRPREDILEWK